MPEQTRSPLNFWFYAGLSVTLSIATGWLFTHYNKIGNPLARFSYDLPFVFRAEIPEEVVMIYLDPAAKRNLNQSTDSPLPRRFHAQLLDRLHEAGARLVFFDLIFDSPS